MEVRSGTPLEKGTRARSKEKEVGLQEPPDGGKEGRKDARGNR